MRFLIQKEYIFLVGLFFSVLIYFLGENSSGGAYLDYYKHKKNLLVLLMMEFSMDLNGFYHLVKFIYPFFIY